LLQFVMPESATGSSLTESHDPQQDYRTIEPWAVGGLVLGVLSAVAMFGGLLWLLAGLGVVANLVALRRIHRNANRSGRGAALLGLSLSVIFSVAPGAQMAASRLILARQAREVADQFFEFLREDSPEKAMSLRFAPDQRRPFDELMWTYFRNDNEAKAQLRVFVATPVVRTILAIGPRADIRFYKTRSVATEGSRGLVSYYYTVTYPDGDGKKTFFVDVLMERNPTVKPGINPWRVTGLLPARDPRMGFAKKQ
jgi:hypothetical protein